MQPLVWIILLNYNNTAETVECLDSLTTIEYDNARVLIVDNGSTLNPVAELRAHYPQAVIIENGSNAGFAEGNNIGLRYALGQGADYLFVLNNDTSVPAGALSHMIDTAQSDPAIGMVCPAIVSYHDHSKRFIPVIDWHLGIGGEWALDPNESASRDVDFATGCAQLVKASVARQIGLYDPAYCFYYEDADWSQRCKRAGYRVVIDTGSIIFHKGTPDQVGQKWSASWFYYLRNLPLFFRRYGRPNRQRPIWWRHTHFCMLEFRKAYRDGNTGKATAVLDGWLAGALKQSGPKKLVTPAWFKALMMPVSGGVLWLLDAGEAIARRLPLGKWANHAYQGLQGLRRRFPIRTTMRQLFKKN